MNQGLLSQFGPWVHERFERHIFPIKICNPSLKVGWVLEGFGKVPSPWSTVRTGSAPLSPSFQLLWTCGLQNPSGLQKSFVPWNLWKFPDFAIRAELGECQLGKTYLTKQQKRVQASTNQESAWEKVLWSRQVVLENRQPVETQMILILAHRSKCLRIFPKFLLVRITNK